MNSFAIWYDAKEKNNTKDDRVEVEEEKNNIINGKVEANINFNLWKLDDAYRNIELKIFKKIPILKNISLKRNLKHLDKCKYFLDIGMKIDNIKNVKTIYIYIPFIIKEENLEDLGEVMIDHKKVIDAIFNENSKVVSQGYENAIEVELPIKKKMKIFMLDFQWKSNISIDEKEEGSIINIDVSNFKVDKGTSSYIRFRIHGKELKKLIISKKIKDNIFKTYSENNEIIDFRLNEKRSMPVGLVNLISGKKEFKIQAIHFLLLMDMKYNLAATGLNYSARALEPNLWREYVGCEIEDSQFVGYHWKEKATLKQQKKDEKDVSDEYNYVGNFNSLIRIEEKRCSIGTIIIYIIAFVILGVIVNTVFEFFVKSLLIKNFGYILKKI